MRFYISGSVQQNTDGGIPVQMVMQGSAIELNGDLADELMPNWPTLKKTSANPLDHPALLAKLALHVLRQKREISGSHFGVLHRSDDCPALILSTEAPPMPQSGSPDPVPATGVQIYLWLQNNKFYSRTGEDPNIQVMVDGAPKFGMWLDAEDNLHRASCTQPTIVTLQDGKRVLEEFWYKGTPWKTVRIIHGLGIPVYETTAYDRHTAHTILEDERAPGSLRPLSAKVLMINSGYSASSWASALECSVRTADSVESIANGIGKRPDLIVIYDDVPLNRNGAVSNDTAAMQASLRYRFGNDWDLSNQFLWGDNAPRSLALAWHLRHSQRLAAVPIMFMTGDSNLASLAGTPGLDSGVTIAQVGRQSVDAIKEVLQALLPRRYPVKAR